MHLDTYADYLRQVEPRIESRTVRALLTTGGPRMKKLHGRYLEVYGPYQVVISLDILGHILNVQINERI